MELNLLTPSATEPYKFSSSKYARTIIKINLERRKAYILSQAIVSDIYSASEMCFTPLIEKQYIDYTDLRQGCPNSWQIHSCLS